MTSKLIFAFALLIPAAGTAAPTQDEVGYSKGALGTAALMNGDNERALEQILASDADANDPAKLLNLGRVYARMGRTADAIRAFQAVIENRDHFDVMLSDGRIMDSRAVARISLKQLQASVAAR